ncbi:MAG: ABC transporter permease [Acidobacteria bacterium]|nr:ABC transporter permease [Acidobacteriota bacterium]
MSPLDLALFALKALRGHRLRSVLSTLGVAIGVASVVLLTGLGEGARIYVTGELATLGSNLLIVLPGKVETSGGLPLIGGVPHDLTLADAEAIRRRVALVTRLAPITVGQATVSCGSLNRHIPVLGTTSDFQEIRRLRVARGEFLPPGEIDRGSPVCVVGTKVQRELFAGANPLGQTLRVGEWRFRVIGVMAPKGESVGFDLDDIVIIPVATAMKVFDQTTLFRVMIEANSYEVLGSVKGQVKEVMIARHGGEEDITLITQDSVLASFNKIFTALTLALAGIAAISLTVAGIGIMNVMLVSVSERTSEIGLMKAVGVTQRQIVLAFLAEASLLSAAGGILGLITAQVLVRLSVQFLPDLPAQVPDWAVMSALFIAVGVGLVFGVWPARRASKLDPIQALARR